MDKDPSQYKNDITSTASRIGAEYKTLINQGMFMDGKAPLDQQEATALLSKLHEWDKLAGITVTIEGFKILNPKYHKAAILTYFEYIQKDYESKLLPNYDRSKGLSSMILQSLEKCNMVADSAGSTIDDELKKAFETALIEIWKWEACVHTELIAIDLHKYFQINLGVATLPELCDQVNNLFSRLEQNFQDCLRDPGGQSPWEKEWKKIIEASSDVFTTQRRRFWRFVDVKVPMMVEFVANQPDHDTSSRYIKVLLTVLLKLMERLEDIMRNRGQKDSRPFYALVFAYVEQIKWQVSFGTEVSLFEYINDASFHRHELLAGT